MLNSICLIKPTFSKIIRPSHKLHYNLKRPLKCVHDVYFDWQFRKISIYDNRETLHVDCGKNLVKHVREDVELDVWSSKLAHQLLVRILTFDTTIGEVLYYFTVTCHLQVNFLRTRNYASLRLWWYDVITCVFTFILKF